MSTDSLNYRQSGLVRKQGDEVAVRTAVSSRRVSEQEEALKLFLRKDAAVEVRQSGPLAIFSGPPSDLALLHSNPLQQHKLRADLSQTCRVSNYFGHSRP